MTGATWAVVPAKSLRRGKSRLRPVLDDEARARFAEELVLHLLRVLGACGLDGILLATDGDDVEALAVAHGAQVLRDVGVPSLSGVVDRALVTVEAMGAARAIVLMADLPRIEQLDVRAVVDALDQHDVVLVRDHLGHHTNALALAPPTAMPTCFGRADSFDAHCAAARAAGLRTAIVAREGIAFDVDRPADHRALTARPPAV